MRLGGGDGHGYAHGMRIAAWLLVLLSVVGCVPKGEDPDASRAVDTASNGRYWHSQPTAIRVYPTTRFVKQGDAAVLEARVELFDDMGDSVKGAGEFRLELRSGGAGSASAGGSAGGGNLLYTWRVEVRTIEDQRTHYDPITRGYLFRLRLDDLAAARRTTMLNVSYTSPDGRHFTAEAPIKTDW